MKGRKRSYNGPHTGEYLSRVAFPLGGIGAGMICLEGAGALSHVSVRSHPDIFHEPLMFAAICVRGETNVPRVLECPVPAWKVFFPWGRLHASAGSGGRDRSYGLPRFASAEFLACFPFATVQLNDPTVPLTAAITGWSPFVPGDADNSSLPVAALEYRFSNPTDKPVEAVFSFHAKNFMAMGSGDRAVKATKDGFVLWQSGSQECPWHQGAFSAVADDPAVKVNCAWFRGGWFDPLTMVWKTIAEADAPEAGPVTEGDPSAGGSLYVPLALGPGEEKTVRVRLAWHVPRTDIRIGEDPEGDDECCDGPGCRIVVSSGKPRHVPWYATRFAEIEQMNVYWRENYETIREQSKKFSDCFYDMTLPDEVIDAIAANLTILKSPTVLRQTDGRVWGWEGCCDDLGCCAGSCTHVWNYALALAHLFPNLERSLRQTEFNENQDARGHQDFRASLPIRPTLHHFHAASDGQLGGIMKVYRDWRISGDKEWVKALWPQVKESLGYCIETWDPDHKGVLEEPHHNTYDIEFWGPDGMCTSFYLGALEAAVAIGKALGDDVSLYERLLEDGQQCMEDTLFNGEYFIQKVQWKGLRAPSPQDITVTHRQLNYSPEAIALLAQEGPKYQYGTGCLSDGVLGAWMAEVCGLESYLDEEQVASHLLAVYEYNFRQDLSEHANPQRPTYALGNEGGLLLCSWPHGGALTFPFPYSNEVWTGIEYQVASHLMIMGRVAEALEIVRAVRDRYDGRVRNPFNEYECGHWYARAMSSYGLLQGMTGVRYDAVEKTLYIKPRIPGDFRVFLCTASGYGTVGIRDGRPFVDVRDGAIPYERVAYEPC